jgi:hypothetical protein
VQREAVNRCSGIVPDAKFVTVPGLQRTTPFHFVLRCAREMRFCIKISQPAKIAQRIADDGKMTGAVGA